MVCKYQQDANTVPEAEKLSRIEGICETQDAG